jgi:Fur family transcriptional regulator, ferric uptake regulator
MFILGRTGTCFTGQPRSASESSAIVFSISCYFLAKVASALKVNVTLTMGRIAPQVAAVNRGTSLPRNYRLIRQIVEESGIGRHLTPSEIYAKALKRRPGIGVSTVYRGLVRLRDLGLVSELHVPGLDAATYEPSGPHHAHFRCSACGAIEDVAYAIPARTIKALALDHGFEIESERVTFEGRCESCRVSGPGNSVPSA